MTYKLRDFLGIASLFISIITIAIALTIWAVPLFKFSLSYLDIPNKVGLSQETIIENYRVLLNYLHFPWIDQLVLADFPVSASGAFHFYEVKLLFYLNYGLMFLSTIGSFFYLKKLKEIKGLWRLRPVFKIAIILPFLFLLLLLVDFDWLFVTFHEIIFDNDAWLFNPKTDPIINVLSQEFFMYSFALFFILIESSFIGSYFYLKKKA